ncbi:MAG TPA: D-alanine--D-alanine ligase family protein [Spirochaetota bacterium]|nr:D-alanine--D-alanine ligase family protein [Spirochaetota bacterium]
MIRVGVLYGGRSGEHDVSRCSAASVIRFLDRAKYHVTAIGIDRDGRWHVQDEPEVVEDKDFGNILKLNKTGSWTVNHYECNGKLCIRNCENNAEVEVDVIFPVVHGTFCEDGTLQGLLELAMVPYVGADVCGSAVGMDKDIAKRLLRDAGIPVVPWIKVRNIDWVDNPVKVTDSVTAQFGFPCFIKPCNAGSSVGISKVKDASDLARAIDEAFEWDGTILVEQAVNAREIEFSVLGNEKPEVSGPGEIRPRHEFYSYEAKYIDSDGAELLIPAELNKTKSDEMGRMAINAYLALNCSGMARVDFFLDKDTGRFFLNEINTLPGFTSISMYPKLWQSSGLAYDTLLDKLIALAFDRRENRNRLRTAFQGPEKAYLS